MRKMVDSTNIYDDPTTYSMVLYYCDGIYAVAESTVRARFPTAILVPCSAVGTNSGIVGDCEPGCMTYQAVIAWVKARRAAGFDPTVYCNYMHDLVPLKVAFTNAGVPWPHWFVSDYDGVEVIPAGCVAKQDKNSAMTGGHFDESVCLDFWPGVDGVYGPGASHSGGTQPMFIKPPFNVECKPGARWFDSINGKDVGPVAGTRTIWNVSPDGNWYEVNSADGSHGTWWVRADQVLVDLASGPPGKDGTNGKDGVDGAPGKEGPQGPPGTVTVESVPTLWDVLKKTFGGAVEK